MSTTEAKPAAPVATMEAFFTRQKANEGIEVPLWLPNGDKSPFSLRIRGIDSDAFKGAEAESRRRMVELASADLTKLSSIAVAAEERLGILSALVISWTFPDEFNAANVRTLLREAPQIADQIDRIASKRHLFFKNGLSNSTPSPGASST
jgi:hypothetical protein